MIPLDFILNNKFPGVNFLSDVNIRDIGNGQEISMWNLESPQPDSKQLQIWSDELDLLYRQTKAVEQRKYPSVQDQLDMIYKDKLDNTNTWVDKITSVKLANPKPTQ